MEIRNNLYSSPQSPKSALADFGVQGYMPEGEEIEKAEEVMKGAK